MSAVRVLLVAAVLGLVAGVALAVHRERVEAEELAAVEEAPDKLSDPSLDGEEPAVSAGDLQAGRVTLAAVEGLPQYPGSFVRPISSGEQLNVAWFGTRDSVQTVLDFYEKQFVANGKQAVGHEYSPSSGYVGYMDLIDHRMHLVSVMRQGDETLVFPSTSYPEKMIDGAAQPPAGVPNIAGAEGGLAFAMGQGPMQREVYVASFAGKTVDDVTEAWRKGLVEKGWQVTRSEEGGMARLDAKGEAGAVEVSIKKDASQRVAVYVTRAGPRGAVP